MKLVKAVSLIVIFAHVTLRFANGNSQGYGNREAAEQQQHEFQQLETLYGLQQPTLDGTADVPIQLTIPKPPEHLQDRSTAPFSSSSTDAAAAAAANAVQARNRRRSNRQWVAAISSQLPSHLREGVHIMLDGQLPLDTPTADAADALIPGQNYAPAHNIPTLSEAALLQAHDVANTIQAAPAPVDSVLLLPPPGAAANVQNSAAEAGAAEAVESPLLMHSSSSSDVIASSSSAAGEHQEQQQGQSGALESRSSSSNTAPSTQAAADATANSSSSSDDAGHTSNTTAAAAAHTSTNTADTEQLLQEQQHDIAQHPALQQQALTHSSQGPSSDNNNNNANTVNDSSAQALGLGESTLNATVLAAGGGQQPVAPLPQAGFLPSRPGLTGPKPPCNDSRGLVEQDGMCVCKRGYAAMPNFKSCRRCLEGWISPGGPLGLARCTPCPQFTTSNKLNTACVSFITQPDVNDALCKPCFNRNQPFTPPSCCPKGSVCCGDWGCCPSDRCFNNATFGNQPYCCASSNCTADTSVPAGCCPLGSTCLNVTGNTQRCCPIGGQCTFGTSTICCNPAFEFCYKTTISSTPTAQTATPTCCNKLTQVACEGEGRCCAAGQSCVGGQRCCNSPAADLCFNSTMQLSCCEPSSRCLVSSFTNMRVCCPLPANEVCGTTCCQTQLGVQQCLYNSICCDSSRVCTNPLDPTRKICCATGQTCNAATGRCT